MNEDSWVDPPMGEQIRHDIQAALATDLATLAPAPVQLKLATLHELANTWDDLGADLIYVRNQEAAGQAVLVCAKQLRAVLGE